MFSDIFEDIITLRLKDIYDNLNTIAKIKPYDKLYHDEKNIFIEDSYIPSIKRWYRGSSRIDTIKFIKYTLVQSYFQLESLKKCVDSESIYLHMTLLNSLKNCIKGLENLQITYSGDSVINYEIKKNINYINKFFS
jgi:hypothetical protein